MGKIHSFDINVAEQYGVNAAILLYNIGHWIEKNKANRKNFYDGKYWTYNSASAFVEIFPYMTERSVRYALQKLIDGGLIVTGNYNKAPWDKTTWYALTEKGTAVCENCSADMINMEASSCKNVTPIPDNKPYNKPNNISCASSPQAPKHNTQIDDFFESMWNLYPKKRGKSAVSKKAKAEIFKAGKETIELAIANYMEEIKRLHREEQYILIGSSFFNTRWRDYVYQPTENDIYSSDPKGKLDPDEIDNIGGTY